MNLLKEELFRIAEFNEAEAEKTGYSNYSYWYSTFRTFMKSKVSTFLLSLTLILVAISFLYPIISKANPNLLALNPMLWNAQPGDGHLFGTDGLGRDIWTRTWYGTRTSLELSLIVALFDVGIGTLVGAAWGYVKKMDRIMTEIYNVLTNIPQTVLLILLAYILRPSFWTIVLALTATGWLSVARFIRNKVISIRDAEYNIASQCLGTPLKRVIIKNIIPFLISIIIMEAALTVPYTIGMEVFLGFIGLGLPPEVVSLGNMVNEGKNNFTVYPYQLAYPTIILSFITITFYIVGNKFSDASDPRNHV